MKIQIQSVNFNSTTELETFLEQKIAILTKFYDTIICANVYFKLVNTKEKENKLTEIKLEIPGNDLVVKKTCKTFEEGILSSIEILKRQLKKTKDKLAR